MALIPNAEYLRGVFTTGFAGYTIPTELTEIIVPGILLASDFHHNSVKQAMVAAGGGAVAVPSAKRFVGSL